MSQIIYKERTKSGKEFYLRYPKEDDLQDLLNYINTLSLEQTFIQFQGEQLSLDEEKQIFDDWLKKIREKRIVKLMAYVDDELAGTTEIIMRDRVGAHVGNLGISVAKKFRGEGIGEILMEKIIEEAKKHLEGIRIIYLGCFSNNTVALKLYGKMGFKEYGRLPGGIKYRGEYIDSINMYKEI